MYKKLMWSLGCACLTVCVGAQAYAQTTPPQTPFTYNIYGTPGHVQMPNALSAPDAQLGFTISQSGRTQKNTLAFQITPRLSGAFRYSKFDNYLTGGRDLYDRSFDLKYQILTQTKQRPALAIGFQDFIGTGIFSAEYIAASKDFGRLSATAGLGWGRLGTYNSIGTIGTRPRGFSGTGGQFEAAKWFRGDFAPFAAASWQASERLTFKAEYSSDAQVVETSKGHFTRKSPFNFGMDYKLGKGAQLSLYALHGSTYGAQLSFSLDPKTQATGATRDGLPLPVAVRAPQSITDLGWSARKTAVAQGLRDGLAPLFVQLGMTLDGMTLEDTRAVVRITNNRFAAQAQAVGRAARLLSVALPGSIETIEIVLMAKGMPVSTVVLGRSDLERFENSPTASADMWQAAALRDAAGIDRIQDGLGEGRKAFLWSIGPYLSASIFDPNSPLMADVGVELNAQWTPTPGFYLDAQIRQRVIGNLDSSRRFSDSVLPHVRSDSNFYNKADGPVVQRLTAAYYFRPATDVYGRITAGYLERQYGGLSTEMLWKPVDSRLALGAEINYVAQRSWEGLGFTPHTVVNTNPTLDTGYVAGKRRYDVATGHVSAYYSFASGFHGTMHIGRYLAGDWGTTLRLDREFNNGWRVGAYATFTDVSFNDFGEGSFDKGITLEIPMDWQLGAPSRNQSTILIQPLLRDGGARVQVDGRLYDQVKDVHAPVLSDRWTRFWR
ncbi:MAG: YjbH domain-containing protein [Planktomarina sp.]